MDAKLTSVLEQLAGRPALFALSHRDYRTNIGGVEQVIASEEKFANNQKAAYIHFHPLKAQDSEKDLAGIRIDGSPVHTLTFDQIRVLMTLFHTAKYPCLGFRIHHLRGWSISELEAWLKTLNTEVTFFIHDYHTCCPQTRLEKNDNRFCGNPPLDSFDCDTCTWGRQRRETQPSISRFVTSSPGRWIAPSQTAADLWYRTFPEMKNRVSVLPFLVPNKLGLKAPVFPQKTAGKIRIAFAGHDTPHKGSLHWQALVSTAPAGAYEFFYLGKPKTHLPNVAEVQVSHIEQGPDAMIKALKATDVDIVFLGSSFPETFAFTYYESLAAGCFVLAFEGSGNIAAQIKLHKNGKVFKDRLELFEFLGDPAIVRALISRNMGKKAAFDCLINEEAFAFKRVPQPAAPVPTIGTMKELLAKRAGPSPLLKDDVPQGKKNLRQSSKLRQILTAAGLKNKIRTTLHPFSALKSGWIKAGKGTDFFTVIALNYLPKAKVLARSLKKHHPHARFHLLICDRPAPPEILKDALFDSITLLDDLELSVDNRKAWIFKHSLMELCTAVKPVFFSYLFERRNASSAVYLDPDIKVFAPMNKISELLKDSSLILTPHGWEPAQNQHEIRRHEVSVLRFGVFNLGFLALKRSSEGLRFLNWWKERLLHFCFDATSEGLFTDQRWVDLAPLFFDQVRILKDKTFNVAPWNLERRLLQWSDNGKLLVEGKRVRFFHFSGHDSGKLDRVLGKNFNNDPIIQKLRKQYYMDISSEGRERWAQWPCAYDYFSGGEPILPRHRQVYRSLAGLTDTFADPWDSIAETSYLKWFETYEKKGMIQTELAAAGRPV